MLLSYTTQELIHSFFNLFEINAIQIQQGKYRVQSIDESRVIVYLEDSELYITPNQNTINTI